MDVWNCVKFTVYSIMIWLTLWNDCHSKWSEHSSSHVATALKKEKKKCFSFQWELLGFTLLLSELMCSRVDSVSRVARYIPRICVSYNQKFVSLDLLHPVPLRPTSDVSLDYSANAPTCDLVGCSIFNCRSTDSALLLWWTPVTS